MSALVSMFQSEHWLDLDMDVNKRLISLGAVNSDGKVPGSKRSSTMEQSVLTVRDTRVEVR
jgi:hypothetical protein